MANHDRRVDDLIAQARELVEEINADGLAAVSAAESRADENVSRYAELQDELSSLRAEQATVERDQRDMPNRLAAAQLEDDYDAELVFKDRYAANKSRLAEISTRIPEVEQELRTLAPRGADRLQLDQYSQVNRAAATPAVQLKKLGTEISNAAEEARGVFEYVLEHRLAESWAWNQNLVWRDAQSREEHPERTVQK